MTTMSLQQSPSPLLNLPAEVRNVIYEFIVGGRLLHDQSQWPGSPKGYQTHDHDGIIYDTLLLWKWTAGSCNITGDRDLDVNLDGNGRRWIDPNFRVGNPSFEKTKYRLSDCKACHCEGPSVWQLLCACHQIYVEALPFFYQSSKFSFKSTNLQSGLLRRLQGPKPEKLGHCPRLRIGATYMLRSLPSTFHRRHQTEQHAPWRHRSHLSQP